MKLLKELGWRTVNAMQESFGPDSLLGRDGHQQVILRRELLVVLRALKTALPLISLN